MADKKKLNLRLLLYMACDWDDGCFSDEVQSIFPEELQDSKLPQVDFD